MKSVICYALTSTSGKPVHEDLLVEELSDNLFKLIVSPGLVLGLAKEDIFKIGDDKKPILIQRGNNIAIQVYKPDGVVNQHSKVKETVLESLNFAALDGITEQQLIFSVLVTEGFSKIEKVLNKVVKDYPGYEWYYGNVYDPIDGITPLNWWKTR